jgi:hypothetical protein
MPDDVCKSMSRSEEFLVLKNGQVIHGTKSGAVRYRQKPERKHVIVDNNVGSAGEKAKYFKPSS